MKRLLFLLLCLSLTGCSYLGATEDIIIRPAELSVSRIETFPETLVTSPGTTEMKGSEHPDSSQPDSTTPDGIQTEVPTTDAPVVVKQLILSLSTKKIHYFDTCSYAKRIKAENRKVVSPDDENTLIKQGYTVCSWCEKHRG